jgi:hypothetical protein
MNITLKIILICILAWFVAQLIKIVYYSTKDKKLNLKVLFSDGGFPSAHSSTVSALTTTIAIVDGFSLLFVISFIFSVIVIRDATSIRREAGKHAVLLNKILKEKKLKEDLGHGWMDAIFGIIIGFIISIMFFMF